MRHAPFRAILCGVVLSAASFSHTAAQQAWRLTEEPTVRIGVVDGAPDYQFNQIRGASRLDDGTIVVANDLELRFYDAAGRHLRTVGGRGDGPGEFRSLHQVQAGAGDTIITWDNLRFRVTKWDRQGDLAAIEQYSPPASPDGASRGYVKLLPDGAMLLEVMVAVGGGEASVWRPPIRLARAESGSATMTFFGSAMYGGIPQQVFDLGGTRVPIVQPFGANLRYVVGSDRVYVTNNEAFEIDVYAFDGQSIARFSSPAREPLSVTEMEMGDVLGRMITSYGSIGVPPGDVERAWSRMEKRRTHPMFVDLIVDMDGFLWAGLNARFGSSGGGSTEYVVVDRDGREVAEVTMPAALRPLEIGLDFVLGEYRGELDVSYVVLYGLMR